MVHLHQPRLSGLGGNPVAPDDVLVRLAAHPAGRHGMELRRGRLPDAVAEALLTHGGADSAVRLHGDRISPAMRRRIAEHPDPEIRDAHAEYVRGCVRRGTRVSLADLEETYGLSRTELARAADADVRAALARSWYDRPLTVQAGLLADPEPAVRAVASEGRHPGIPPESADRCLADPATRANAARQVPLTAEQFARLITVDDEEVREALAANPHLTPDTVARLLDSADPLVRVALAQNRQVDDETRARLYALVEAERAAGSIAAESALTWNFIAPDWLRTAPLAERLRHLDSPYPVFRRVLASSRGLPEEAWRRLDEDPDLGVRRAAARRPDAPADVLERLLRAHGDVSHIRPTLVEHPNFPRHRLRTFADEPYPNARRLALKDPDLPEPLLEQLAADAEPFVRRAVARHPRVSGDLLDRLLADPDPNVANDAASHPALSPARMYGILAAADL
ncbi:hypothetical protein ABZ896_29495 [Streptomyces sp. NPDC047072]|uniref:hypothetical protein n=1 Tax=Streptomyces sp. NPDC047072 TaxID=3154809 RepID=UPI00341147F9